MKKTQFYAGIVSLVIAAILAILNFSKIDLTFSESLPMNVHIYPAAFFALLGAVLIFLGVKQLFRS